MIKIRLLLVPFLIVSLVSQSVWAEEGAGKKAKEKAKPAAESTEAVPKFFLVGMILKAVASEVFSMFGKWAIGKLTGGMSLSIPVESLLGGVANFVNKSASESGVAPPTVSGDPVAPKGMENAPSGYHGVHIAIAVLDAEGKNLNLRPLNEGFKSGERFKLRVVSTFTGDMKIENINPKGERKHIYPADEDMRIRLEGGKETLIPAGQDEFFEFTRTTGEEQLVITLRDPSANAMNMSRSKVYRQDEPYGSNFVQVASSGTYPVISEAVSLVHY